MTECAVVTSYEVKKQEELLKPLNEPSSRSTVSTNSISSIDSETSSNNKEQSSDPPLTSSNISIRFREEKLDPSKVIVTASSQVNLGGANHQPPIVSSTALQIVRPAPLKKLHRATVSNNSEGPKYSTSNKTLDANKSNAHVNTNSTHAKKNST